MIAHLRGLLTPLVALVAILPPGIAAQPSGGGTHADNVRTLAFYLGGTPGEGEPVKCGLSLLAAAYRNRALLPAAAKAALAALDLRPVLQTSIVAGGFRIHFDTSGVNTPALLDAQNNRIPGTARIFVDSTAAIIAHVAANETGVLGFDPPPPDGGLGGGDEYDIYIQELGLEYGETVADAYTTQGGTCTNYMRIDNDFIFVTPSSNKGLPALRVTLAHEFHHAIQIGRYGFWTNDIWFHEITSVWMEDVVYTEVNDYYNYLRANWSHFKNPGTPLNANDIIMYSRGIWGQFMTKKYGPDAMRQTWEKVRSSPPLDALDQALRQHYGVTLPQAFADWCSWNAYTASRADTLRGYTEGMNYPAMIKKVYDIPGNSRRVDDNLACLASLYYRMNAGPDTLDLIVVHTANTCASFGATVPFSFTVSGTKPDDSYRATSSGLFLKLEFASPSDWVVWEAGKGGPLPTTTIAEGMPYPNPFLPEKQPFVFLTADAPDGTLSVYSTNMELMYTEYQTTRTSLGRTSFSWNGRNSHGEIVPTGIYLFVLTLQNKTITGKVAVVRQ